MLPTNVSTGFPSSQQLRRGSINQNGFHYGCTIMLVSTGNLTRSHHMQHADAQKSSLIQVKAQEGET